MAMICPICPSTNIKKNGHKRGKQNHYCKDCGRQFIDSYSPKGYPSDVKKHCLHLYLEGNGLRRIERLTGVCHNTVINWGLLNKLGKIAIALDGQFKLGET